MRRRGPDDRATRDGASGGRKNPYYIRRDGHLVAFTLQLAKPTAEEVNFFDSNFGSPSTARISVLRKGRTRKTRLDHRLVRQSEEFRLDRYFGSKPDVRVRRADPGQGGQLDRAHGADLGAAPRHEPGARELVALVAAEGQLRAAAEPPAVRDGGPARGEQVRLHLPRRAPALHGHVRPEQPRHERRSTGAIAPSTGSVIALASRSMTTEGWIFMVGFRVFDVGLLIVWLIWFFRLRDDDDDSRGDDGGGGEGPGPPGGRDGPGGGGDEAAAGVVAARPRPRARPLAPAGHRAAARPRAACAGAGACQAPELTGAHASWLVIASRP